MTSWAISTLGQNQNKSSKTTGDEISIQWSDNKLLYIHFDLWNVYKGFLESSNQWLYWAFWWYSGDTMNITQLL